MGSPSTISSPIIRNTTRPTVKTTAMVGTTTGAGTAVSRVRPMILRWKNCAADGEICENNASAMTTPTARTTKPAGSTGRWSGSMPYRFVKLLIARRLLRDVEHERQRVSPSLSGRPLPRFRRRLPDRAAFCGLILRNRRIVFERAYCEVRNYICIRRESGSCESRGSGAPASETGVPGPAPFRETCSL